MDLSGECLTGECFNSIFTEPLICTRTAHSTCVPGLNTSQLNNIHGTYVTGGINCITIDMYLDNISMYAYCDQYHDAEILDDSQVYISRYYIQAEKVMLSEAKPIEDLYIWNDPELCAKLVKSNFKLIAHIKNPSIELCNYAIENCAFAVTSINPSILTHDMLIRALTKTSWIFTTMLQHIKDTSLITEELCRYAVSLNPSNYKSSPIQTEIVQLAAVTNAGNMLKLIENPSDAVIIAALKNDGSALMYVKNQTSEHCSIAINKTPSALMHVHVQTPELCIAAVTLAGHVLSHVKNKTLDICMIAVKTFPYALQHFPTMTQEIFDEACRINPAIKTIPILCKMNPSYVVPFNWMEVVRKNSSEIANVPEEFITEAMQYLAVSDNPININLITNPCESVCILAVTNNWELINCISTPSLKTCLAAIKTNPFAIKFIKTPSEVMKLRAVKKNGMVLQYIKDQSEPVCFMAVMHTPHALIYATVQSERVCLKAVSVNGMLLQFVKHKTYEICKAAVQQNGDALIYVDNQTDDLCWDAIQNNPLSCKWIKSTAPEFMFHKLHYFTEQTFNLIEEFDDTTEMVLTVAAVYNQFLYDKLTPSMRNSANNMQMYLLDR